MGIITKKVVLEGIKGRREVADVLFDTGSTYSIIRPDIADELDIILSLPSPMRFRTAKDGEVMEAREGIRLNFYIEGYRFSDEFIIIPGLTREVIIGASTMQKWRIKLDLEKEEVIIRPEVTELWLL